MTKKEIAKHLQHLLADTYALYLKTQNFHWNVKGPNFFSLHLFFEKQYTELAEAIDEIAERIQTLGFYVEGHFGAFQKCCIDQAKKPLKAKKMVEILLADHEKLISCARQIGEWADQENDQATVDLMARRLGAHEKFAWMLKSHIKD